MVIALFTSSYNIATMDVRLVLSKPIFLFLLLHIELCSYRTLQVIDKLTLCLSEDLCKKCVQLASYNCNIFLQKILGT